MVDRLEPRIEEADALLMEIGYLERLRRRLGKPET